MFKFLLLLLVSIFILSGCHGCSFIKEHFAKKPNAEQLENNTQQNPEENQKQPDQIPTNPFHS